MADRLNQLQSFYNDDPNDPFNIYGLALEYLKSDHEKSKEFFKQLLDQHPAYIPTYYHAAKLFESTGERELAISIYQRGITQARNAKDNKALRELQAAYDELIFE